MKHLTVITVLFLAMIGALIGCTTITKAVQTSSNHSTNNPLSDKSNTSLQNSQNSIAPNVSSDSTKNPTTAASEPNQTSKESNPPSSQFDSIITQSMQYVAPRTKVAFMAPTEPTYVPAPYDSNEVVNAEVSASTTSYQVDLQLADKSYPLNSSALSQPPNSGLGNIIGGFGAQAFQSGQQALAQLNKTEKGIDPAYIEPPSNMTSTTVNLGYGIQGKLYHSKFDPIVQWQEGEWTLQVTDAGEQNDIREAAKLVAYFNSNLLPETHGVFGVNIAGDGEHTSAKWVFDNVVYSCGDYHSALQAAKMAVSMRSYPSGNLKP